MSKKEELFYKIQVEPNEEYTIMIRIGDAQDGDHNVFGTCPYDKEPENDNPEWVSYLGKGRQIKNKVLFVSSATQDNNPNTNNVSVRLFINDEQIEPYEGDYELTVDDSEIAYFNQKIDFV
nr:hypothetical protein [uncultured Draconibacterium sp.]